MIVLFLMVILEGQCKYHGGVCVLDLFVLDSEGEAYSIRKNQEPWRIIPQVLKSNQGTPSMSPAGFQNCCKAPVTPFTVTALYLMPVPLLYVG